MSDLTKYQQSKEQKVPASESLQAQSESIWCMQVIVLWNPLLRGHMASDSTCGHQNMPLWIPEGSHNMANRSPPVMSINYDFFVSQNWYWNNNTLRQQHNMQFSKPLFSDVNRNCVSTHHSSLKRHNHEWLGTYWCNIWISRIQISYSWYCNCKGRIEACPQPEKALLRTLNNVRADVQ
jgi:hypothetical protein